MNGSIHNKIYHDFSNLNAKLKIGIFFPVPVFFSGAVLKMKIMTIISMTMIFIFNAIMHCR